MWVDVLKKVIVANEESKSTRVFMEKLKPSD
jgi:hypothetical protein